MDAAKPRPLVAVGIIVLNAADQILIGERVGSFGAGTYQLPGGHLEFGKTFEEAARDEVMEETGLTDIVFERIITLQNEIIYDKHYVNLGFQVRSTSGTPMNPEPDKSRNWKWYDIDSIPEPLFASSKAMIDAWKAGTFFVEVRT